MFLFSVSSMIGKSNSNRLSCIVLMSLASRRPPNSAISDSNFSLSLSSSIASRFNAATCTRFNSASFFLPMSSAFNMSAISFSSKDSKSPCVGSGLVAVGSANMSSCASLDLTKSAKSRSSSCLRCVSSA